MSDDFSPDWVSPPGDTIQSIMDERSIPHNDLAEEMGMSAAELDDLIAGKKRIDQHIAMVLADTIGGSELFWMRREEMFRSEARRLGVENKYSENTVG